MSKKVFFDNETKVKVLPENTVDILPVDSWFESMSDSLLQISPNPMKDTLFDFRSAYDNLIIPKSNPFKNDLSLDMVLPDEKKEPEEIPTKTKRIKMSGDSNRDLAYPVGANLIDGLPEIKKMVKAIKKEYKDQVNSNDLVLVGRGSSGAIIGGIIASILNVNYVHVHKPDENSHNQSNTNYIRDQSVIVIVDDLISSGHTINTITDDLMRNHFRYTKRQDTTICLCIATGVIENNLNFKFDTIIAKYFY